MIRVYKLDRMPIQDLFVEWLYNNGFDGYGCFNNQENENVTNRGGYENDIFLINPYYWGDDEEIQDEPNFVFKPENLEIEWYKYPMRSGFSNKPIDTVNMKRILEICKESMSNNHVAIENKIVNSIDDIWDRKINIELTLHELEDLIISLRVANKVINGKVGSKLEEKLNNIAQLEKPKC